jgi:hypothetical protein
MTSNSDTMKKENSVHGTTDITVKIFDLDNAGPFVETILSNPDMLFKITKIEIETREEDEDSSTDTSENEDAIETADTTSTTSAQSDGSKATKQEETVSQQSADGADDETTRLCQPIVDLLAAISTAGGSLQIFVWRSEHGSYGFWYKFNRPLEFWTALYAHARTLRVLVLGYFSHELHKVPSPQVAFPNMKELMIDATTAHGDDGAAVDTLLKGCPHLESLIFDWPNCDLESCQIKNVTWNYSFPQLRRLMLRGNGFAPQAYIDFLARCPEVEEYRDAISFYELVEGGAEVEFPLMRFAKIRFPIDVFPRLRILSGHSHSLRLDEWFDENHVEGGRPIESLDISSGQNSGALKELLDLSDAARGRLKYLSIGTYAGEWRVDDDSNFGGETKEEEAGETSDCSEDGEISDYSDDGEASDYSEAGKDAQSVAAAMEDAASKLNPNLTKTARALKNLLPHLPALDTLNIDMGSGPTLIRNAAGALVKPPLASSSDLRLLLSLLPSNPRTNIRTLEINESEAMPLDREFLDSVRDELAGLDCIIWNGMKKVVYRVKREEDKVVGIEEENA